MWGWFLLVPCFRGLRLWANCSGSSGDGFCTKSNISWHELMLVMVCDNLWYEMISSDMHELILGDICWCGRLLWSDWGELMWAIYNLMLACDVMLANISKFREQGTMSNAHAVLDTLCHPPMYFTLLVPCRHHLNPLSLACTWAMHSGLRRGVTQTWDFFNGFSPKMASPQ